MKIGNGILRWTHLRISSIDEIVITEWFSISEPARGVRR